MPFRGMVFMTVFAIHVQDPLQFKYKSLPQNRSQLMLKLDTEAIDRQILENRSFPCLTDLLTNNMDGLKHWNWVWGISFSL